MFSFPEIRTSSMHQVESGEYSGDLEVIDESEEVLIQAENERRRGGGDELLPHSRSGLTKRDVDLLSELMRRMIMMMVMMMMVAMVMMIVRRGKGRRRRSSVLFYQSLQ